MQEQGKTWSWANQAWLEDEFHDSRTDTSSGLRVVKAELEKRKYPIGVVITKAQMNELLLIPGDF